MIYQFLKTTIVLVFSNFILASYAIFLLAQSEPKEILFFVSILIGLYSILGLIINYLTKNKKNTQAILMSVYSFISLYFLNLIVFPFFRGFNIENLIVLLLIYLAVFLLFMFKKNYLNSNFLRFAFALFFISPIFSHTLNSHSQRDLEYISHIKLDEKPNIYLLVFDSLISPELAKKNLDVNPKYESLFKRSFFSFNRGLNLRVPSWHALNAVMRLDQKEFYYQGGYIQGIDNSPLSAIAKNNGYDIKTGYEVAGAAPTIKVIGKSKFVTEFITPDGSDLELSALCIDIGNSTLLRFRLFGACDVINYIKKHYSNIFEFFGNNPHKNWHQTLLRNIKETALSSSSPTISLFYTYDPLGHTSADYDNKNSEDRDFFKKKFSLASEKFVNLMQEIKNLILQDDPTALVIVFGDHGVYLSRGMEIDEDNKNFVLTDRHKVQISVLRTRNECSKEKHLKKINKDFVTPSMVLIGLFDCLSLDKDQEIASKILLPRIENRSEITKYID